MVAVSGAAVCCYLRALLHYVESLRYVPHELAGGICSLIMHLLFVVMRAVFKRALGLAPLEYWVAVFGVVLCCLL